MSKPRAKIEDLDLSLRTRNALVGAGIYYLSDLMNYTHGEIMEIEGLSKVSFIDLLDRLSAHEYTILGANKIQRPPPVLAVKLRDKHDSHVIALRSQARQVLVRENPDMTIGCVTKKNIIELLAIPGLGKQKLEDIITWLDELNLRLMET